MSYGKTFIQGSDIAYDFALLFPFSEPNYMNWIVEKIFDDSANSMSEHDYGSKPAAPGSARPENDMQDEKFDSLKDDETISKRYYAGVMSDKLEKYLKGMPACTFLIRRDEINLNTYIISSVGYVTNSKSRKKQSEGRFGRSRPYQPQTWSVGVCQNSDAGIGMLD